MLPRLQEAARRNPDAVRYLSDCDQCMREFPRQSRQYLKCAYEPPVEGARAWESPDYSGKPLETCCGYTTKLPEVGEAAEVRFYLENGSLSSLIKGQITDNMRDAVAVLLHADAEVTRWAKDNPEKK